MKCQPKQALQVFYQVSVIAVLITAVKLLMTPYFMQEKTQYLRIAIYIIWASYGLVPTLHWVYLHGGFDSPLVQMLFWRICVMYLMATGALLLYVSHLPERCVPGRVDFIGSSHQWWHILVVILFYWWHNTGLLYFEYRQHHSCEKEFAYLHQTQ